VPGAEASTSHQRSWNYYNPQSLSKANMAAPAPWLSKLFCQRRCLLLSFINHVLCSPIPRVLDGYGCDIAHTDKLEPEFHILGYILKTRWSDCLKQASSLCPRTYTTNALSTFNAGPYFFRQT
jgi:hypothetical protein